MQQTMRYHYGSRRRRQATRRAISRPRPAVTAPVAAGARSPGWRLIRGAFELMKIAAVLGLMYAFLLLMFIHGG